MNYHFLSNIETSSICNFNCVFCGNRFRKIKGFMNISMFEKILETYNKHHVSRIDLTPITGEFFCNEECLSILDICKSYKNITFFLITNGSIMFSNDYYSYIRKLQNMNIRVSLYGDCYEEFQHITNSNQKVYTSFWYSDYLKFLKLEKLQVYFRTLKNIKNLKLDLSEFNISDVKSCFSNWETDSKKTTNGCKYCPYFLNFCIKWNGVVSFCNCKDVNDEYNIGTFDCCGNFQKSKSFNELIKDYLKFGRKSPDNNHLCFSCDVPEMLHQNNVENDLNYKQKNQNVLGANEIKRILEVSKFFNNLI